MIIIVTTDVHPSVSAAIADPGSTVKRPGRPRSTARHHAILEATRALLATNPYEQLTIERIAAEAGVSKQTIYNWWPSKAAIVTEAVISGYVTMANVPPVDTGDIAADLRSWLHARFAELADRAAVSLVRAMTAAAAEGTDTERIYNLLALPAREYLLQRLTAAREQGQLRPGVDLDAVVDTIVGFLLLQALAAGPAVTPARADGLVDILLQGIQPDASSPAERGHRRSQNGR